MASRVCKNSAEKFCYICGRYTTTDQRQNITKAVERCYFAYFGCHLGDQDKPWAPHNACKTCVENLRLWYAGKRKKMPFAVPMIWREPLCHLSDCYFCMTKIDGITKKNKSSIAYPDVPSAIRPVPHSEDLPVPVPLEILDSSSDNDSSGDSDEYILPPDDNSP